MSTNSSNQSFKDVIVVSENIMASEHQSVPEGSSNTIRRINMEHTLALFMAEQLNMEFYFQVSIDVDSNTNIVYKTSKRYPADPTIYVWITVTVPTIGTTQAHYELLDVPFVESLSFLGSVGASKVLGQAAPETAALLLHFAELVLNPGACDVYRMEKLTSYGSVLMPWTKFKDMRDLVRGTPEGDCLRKE